MKDTECLCGVWKRFHHRRDVASLVFYINTASVRTVHPSCIFQAFSVLDSNLYVLITGK